MSLDVTWAPGGDPAETPFPLQNLPLGVGAPPGGAPRCVVAIGTRALDMPAAAGALGLDPALFAGPAWNAVMAAGAGGTLREALTGALREGSARADALAPHLIPLRDLEMRMPFAVAEFTDFYAGRHHAINVGTMFRGAADALPANWLHVPIGYNGRASSVVVSGTGVRRPWGQIKGPDDGAPRLAPSARFDFELELGAVVGRASDGPLTVAGADAAIFGYVLLNDWSARDIQAWEYRPLGPFQSKATATTIGPWIVMADALAPFRVDAPAREVPLLPHLREPGPMLYDVDLSVELMPEGGAPCTVTRTNYREMYYSSAQQLAHHASSGCPMRVGDLLGSGTVSGPERGNRGSLLELSWGGEEPLDIGGGATRSFVEDHDTVTLRGAARADGYTIGFGDCAGRVLPAGPNPWEGP